MGDFCSLVRCKCVCVQKTLKNVFTFRWEVRKERQFPVQMENKAALTGSVAKVSGWLWFGFCHLQTSFHLSPNSEHVSGAMARSPGSPLSVSMC